MSQQGQTLKAMVDKILQEAVEKLIAAFEKKIVEYEEKLRIAREEVQKQQQLLDMILTPKIQEVRGRVYIPSVKWDIPETQQTKADPGPSIKIETGERGVKQFTPESRAVKIEVAPKAVKMEVDWSEVIKILSDSEGDTDNSSDIDQDEDWKPHSSGRFRQWLTEPTTITPRSHKGQNSLL